MMLAAMKLTMRGWRRRLPTNPTAAARVSKAAISKNSDWTMSSFISSRSTLPLKVTVA
jgi:hypothetical protein